MSFWSELRRRKVVRATLAYLAAAFAIAQVVQLLIDALELPDNLLRIVVIVEIALLPLVIAAAWAFDWSSEGVHQTDSAAPPIRWRRIAPAALATIVLLGVGLIYAGRRPESNLDANLVAVLPFRVSGSSDIGYLREGMMDLLAAKLTGEGGVRAADTRSMMSALRATRLDASEIAREDAIDVARSLGARYVLLGSVVGSPQQFTVAATITDVRTGKEVHAENTGTVDALPAFIDRFAAELLSVGAGEGQRLAELTSTSLPALRSYLAGQADFRAARFESAARNYARALQIDSTFALAAMGHIAATGWTSVLDTTGNWSSRLLVKYQNRLGGVDRAMAQALVGTSYPDRRTVKETIDAWQAVVTTAPDRGEAWFNFGDAIAHTGKLIGYQNADEAAYQAFSRALAVDSAHLPAVVHLMDIAIVKRDSAAVNRYVQIAKARGMPLVASQAAGITRMSQSPAATAALRAAIDSMDFEELFDLAWSPFYYGNTITEPLIALERLVSTAALPAEQRLSHRAAYGLYLGFGMPERAAQARQRLIDLDRTLMTSEAIAVVRDALYGDGDEEFARHAVGQLNAKYTGLEARERVAAVCAIEQWNLWHQQPSRARAAARAFREVAPTADEFVFAQLCARLLDALHANLAGAADARPTLLELDNFLREGPNADASLINIGNIVAARLWERSGDNRAAYRAILRESDLPKFFPLFTTRLREQARLAALTGDRASAIERSTRYLALREQAEPGPRRKDDRVRNELARLGRDQRAN